MLIPGLYLIMLGLPFINFLFLHWRNTIGNIISNIIYSIKSAAWSSIRMEIDAVNFSSLKQILAGKKS
jgi:hypothetical protein